ncbi:NYN domain-containing protein [Nocardioides mangrovi]|uniref:NYN domain-containing protein n=1 Tax=Nocardioides mangrovi TaxID=2874580 RepID=A0ABS7U6Z9_9ACTN|nr:NYN domain-containing protein [Nocardioides mangrovi]MBZ5736758.1 NYN domain-containing protein [Nocardioides mangrovi]
MTAVGPDTLDGLPEQVRARVVAMTADVLPDVPRLPPAVRRVASFAPARRARLGAGAILDALLDDELRERVGVQVSARPAPDAGDVPAVAARSWLVRPEGWELVVTDASARLAAALAPAVDDRELERLRARLADAEQATRELRAAHKAQVEEYKTENTSLRRKLGEERAAHRAARAETEAAEQSAAEARRTAETATAALEKDNRRLRAQVEQLEAAEARGRRDARAERDEASLRARLLLETVIDAANGLRRELALPTVEGAPADRVEADVAEAGVRTPSSAGVLGPGSAALLEQLLAMPRSRLVVDGYNVSKTAWPTSSLEAQRLRLVGALAPLVARTGAETTVVFDAAETDHRPPVTAPRGVKVLYSPRGVIADDVIRDLVAAEPTGRVVVVVTGDRAVAVDVTRDGARVVVPEALLELVAR